jgi:hypothetical protein
MIRLLLGAYRWFRHARAIKRANRIIRLETHRRLARELGRPSPL